MDIICTKCGEPWSMDYVLHEEPEAFERQGALITHCPTCGSHDTPVASETERLMMRAAAEVCGDDIDGAASLMDDFFGGY